MNKTIISVDKFSTNKVKLWRSDIPWWWRHHELVITSQLLFQNKIDFQGGGTGSSVPLWRDIWRKAYRDIIYFFVSLDVLLYPIPFKIDFNGSFVSNDDDADSQWNCFIFQNVRHRNWKRKHQIFESDDQLSITSWCSQVAISG